jgi:hypothetical protein
VLYLSSFQVVIIMNEISKNIENMIELFENMKLKLKENENLKEENEKLKEENEKLKEENKNFYQVEDKIVKFIRNNNNNLLYSLKLFSPSSYLLDLEILLNKYSLHYNNFLNIINNNVLMPKNRRLLEENEIYDY